MSMMPLTREVISCAIEVHRELGPGLLESTYQRCLAHEFHLRGIECVEQWPLPVRYKGLELEECYRIDALIENRLIVELKAVQQISPLHEAQLLTYMKLADIHVGLLLNFNEVLLRDGIRRMVL